MVVGRARVLVMVDVLPGTVSIEAIDGVGTMLVREPPRHPLLVPERIVNGPDSPEWEVESNTSAWRIVPAGKSEPHVKCVSFVGPKVRCCCESPCCTIYTKNGGTPPVQWNVNVLHCDGGGLIGLRTMFLAFPKYGGVMLVRRSMNCTAAVQDKSFIDEASGMTPQDVHQRYPQR